MTMIMATVLLMDEVDEADDDDDADEADDDADDVRATAIGRFVRIQITPFSSPLRTTL